MTSSGYLPDPGNKPIVSSIPFSSLLLAPPAKPKEVHGKTNSPEVRGLCLSDYVCSGSRQTLDECVMNKTGDVIIYLTRRLRQL